MTTRRNTTSRRFLSRKASADGRWADRSPKRRRGAAPLLHSVHQRRSRVDAVRVRVFTAVNLSLWVVLFIEWIGYSTRVGFGDPVSSRVMLILGLTAVLLLFLGFLRLRRRLRT